MKEFVSEAVFGLSEKNLAEIKAIYSKYKNIEKVVLYGSRAKGNYKPTSDIDMTIFDDGTFTLIDLLNVIDDFEESNLPYLVDISQFSKLTNKDLINHINRIGIDIYSKD